MILSFIPSSCSLLLLTFYPILLYFYLLPPTPGQFHGLRWWFDDLFISLGTIHSLCRLIAPIKLTYHIVLLEMAVINIPILVDVLHLCFSSVSPPWESAPIPDHEWRRTDLFSFLIYHEHWKYPKTLLQVASGFIRLCLICAVSNPFWKLLSNRIPPPSPLTHPWSFYPH